MILNFRLMTDLNNQPSSENSHKIYSTVYYLDGFDLITGLSLQQVHAR